jgi:tetratricopeptide (TPR) repeat protein
LLNAPAEIEHDNPALLRALAGWNQLAELDVAGALASFRTVSEQYPEETIGWEGLRAAAEQAKDHATFAEACAALGDAVSDPARGAELWEEAATILLDRLGDEERGEFALSRAVARDIRRFSSFDRLFRRVRGRRDAERLLELIAERLEVTEDSEEIAKLFWERARVLRESGDRQGALAALENVTFLEPDHVGALALSGEIYIKNGQLAEAAENLGRLAALSEAPAKQRLMSGVAAVDLYENKLGDIDKAFEVLLGLYRSGLSTLPVRERLARVAAKASAWHEATQALEHLMTERESREGRIEAARLALAIYRDRLDDAHGATAAAEKLLTEAPDDGEALDLVLTGAVPMPAATRLLTRGRDALMSALLNNPLDAERVDRLARIAANLEDAPLRQAALGVLVALGEGSHEIDHELSILDRRVAHIPQIAIDERSLPELCDEEERGPLGDLMRELAPTFAAALGPNLAALGVTKKDRVDPRAGLPLRNEIAAWAGALGVGDFELFIGGREAHGVYAVATELPAIVLGPVVSAPLSAAHRQAVARELFALKRGTTILRHRDINDVSALFVAACRVAGLNPPSPEYAMLGEFQRLLGKEMSRRTRKLLPELGTRALSARQDPATWARAAVASLDRMASIAAGDVSWVLCGGSPEGRGRLATSRETEVRARRVFQFVLSPTYLTLREKLGMGVR